MLPDGKANWEPHQHYIACPTEGCGRTQVIWGHEFVLGLHWKCSSCGLENEIALGVANSGYTPLVDEASEGASA
jgi:hypothetical protein